MINKIKAEIDAVADKTDIWDNERWKKTRSLLVKSWKEWAEELEKELTPKLFHEIYEEEARRTGWETQDSCKTAYEDLPPQNKETMERTIKRIIEKVLNGGKK